MEILLVPNEFLRQKAKRIIKITNDDIFLDIAQRWTDYSNNRLNKAYSLCHKIIFKLFYY